MEVTKTNPESKTFKGRFTKKKTTLKELCEAQGIDWVNDGNYN